MFRNGISFAQLGMGVGLSSVFLAPAIFTSANANSPAPALILAFLVLTLVSFSSLLIAIGSLIDRLSVEFDRACAAMLLAYILVSLALGVNPAVGYGGMFSVGFAGLFWIARATGSVRFETISLYSTAALTLIGLGLLNFKGVIHETAMISSFLLLVAASLRAKLEGDVLPRRMGQVAEPERYADLIQAAKAKAGKPEVTQVKGKRGYYAVNRGAAVSGLVVPYELDDDKFPENSFTSRTMEDDIARGDGFFGGIDD